MSDFFKAYTLKNISADDLRCLAIEIAMGTEEALCADEISALVELSYKRDDDFKTALKAVRMESNNRIMKELEEHFFEQECLVMAQTVDNWWDKVVAAPAH